jgi:hypothetical protein
MKHILDCNEQEILEFVIRKTYKDHTVLIKPITDHVFPSDNKLKQELHVFFHMHAGCVVNLGQILQEVANDDVFFEHWISERLKYVANFLLKI